MNKKLLPLMLFLTGLLLFPAVSAAQSDAAISFRLNKDWGYNNGSRIQGTFTYEVAADPSIVRVEFLLNDSIIAEDTEIPFEYRLETDAYDPGIHKLSVIGYDAHGQAFLSNELTRRFLTAAEARDETIRLVLWLIVPIIGLVLIGTLVTFWLGRNNDGQGRSVAGSVWGAAICPNCKRPFALHLWKINLGFSALDRCPYCGKWSRVRRAAADDIEAAEKALADAANSQTTLLTPEEALRKQLDSSKYDPHF